MFRKPRRLGLGLATACAAATVSCAAPSAPAASGCGDDAPPDPVATGPAVVVEGDDGDCLAGILLDDPYVVPAVTLTDTSAEPFDLVTDTGAALTLVFFGYTHCPDVCSLVMADLTFAMNRISEDVRDDVEVLFVTTDPARDTPEVIDAYLQRFDPSFEGLTGELVDIETAASALGVDLEGLEELPGGGYLVGHGAQIVGIDADDRGAVVWTEGTPSDDLVSDIERLVGEAA